jgi:hypothetical protein
MVDQQPTQSRPSAKYKDPPWLTNSYQVLFGGVVASGLRHTFLVKDDILVPPRASVMSPRVVEGWKSKQRISRIVRSVAFESIFIGAIGGLWFGSEHLLATYRKKVDYLNTGAAGLLVGGCLGAIFPAANRVATCGRWAVLGAALGCVSGLARAQLEMLDQQ